MCDFPTLEKGENEMTQEDESEVKDLITFHGAYGHDLSENDPGHIFIPSKSNPGKFEVFTLKENISVLCETLELED